MEDGEQRSRHKEYFCLCEQKAHWVSNINLSHTDLRTVMILRHAMRVSKLTVVFNCATLHLPYSFVENHLYTIGFLAKAYLGPSTGTYDENRW